MNNLAAVVLLEVLLPNAGKTAGRFKKVLVNNVDLLVYRIFMQLK